MADYDNGNDRKAGGSSVGRVTTATHSDKR
jgi:hypothetical protein